ncbi:MAG TPA: hypothetical protein VFY93_07390 [Planctomycetota bacterium]|nr:hypothetical protein [Planctomycetota bacterium]
MRQELIDLLLGELDPAEAEALKARIRGEPELQRELFELESLFGLMRRGEAVEPLGATRAAVVAAAARVRTPLLVQLRALPGLVAYRFRRSARFRIAVISLAAHVVLIAILAHILLRRDADPRADVSPYVTFKDGPAEDIKPAHEFQARLLQRRLPQSTRLRQYGVEGQEQAIEKGIGTLLTRQRPDGSFGDAGETGYAALALLAQGDCSAQATARGYAIRIACGDILAEAKRGQAHGAMLAALVEDFSLSYAFMNEFERMGYQTAIRQLVLAVPDDDISREALLLARLAGFAIPAGRDLGDAALVVSGDRTKLLDAAPTRLRVTAALARGRLSPDPDLAKAWAAPLFEKAMADLEAGKASGVVLLTLQSPYRL